MLKSKHWKMLAALTCNRSSRKLGRGGWIKEEVGGMARSMSNRVSCRFFCLILFTYVSSKAVGDACDSSLLQPYNIGPLVLKLHPPPPKNRLG